MAKTTRRPPRIKKPADRDPSAGIIRADELYNLSAIKRRLKLTDSAWWELAKSGLPHKQIGKRKLILGKDVIAFFDKLPNVEVPE